MATVETSGPFDPRKAGAWIARGRPPAEAVQLAVIWRRFPDLPAGAEPEARMQRLRERVGAMRPLNDAIARRNAQERERRNFAFTASRLAAGQGDDRDRAILAGQDIHGFAWMAAVRYADGLQAARSGWPYAPYCTGSERDAYDHGFREGGATARISSTPPAGRCALPHHSGSRCQSYPLAPCRAHGRSPTMLAGPRPGRVVS